MIDWLANNWGNVVILVIFAIFMITATLQFHYKPTDEKIAKFKEWLLYMVAKAEKELGGGTGQLKLRYVYDKALSQFPALTAAIPFEKFSEYVDEALEKFKGMLLANKKVQDYIGTTEA